MTFNPPSGQAKARRAVAVVFTERIARMESTGSQFQIIA
jgi:hypothetical protein